MSEDQRVDLSNRLLQSFDVAAEMVTMERENEERIRRLLLELLDVADSFDRFLPVVEAVETPTPEQVVQWSQTFLLIGKQLQQFLHRAAVIPIECIGLSADPYKHEILDVKHTVESEDGIIIEEFAKGYTWNGRLLRRPRVVVAAPPEEKNT